MSWQALFEEAVKPKLQLESIQRAAENDLEPLMETSILALGVCVTVAFFACREVSQLLLSV